MVKKNNISDQEMLKNFKKIERYFSKEFKPYVIGKITRGKNKVKLNAKINWC